METITQNNNEAEGCSSLPSSSSPPVSTQASNVYEVQTFIHGVLSEFDYTGDRSKINSNGSNAVSVSMLPPPPMVSGILRTPKKWTFVVVPPHMSLRPSSCICNAAFRGAYPNSYTPAATSTPTSTPDGTNRSYSTDSLRHIMYLWNHLGVFLTSVGAKQPSRRFSFFQSNFRDEKVSQANTTMMRDGVSLRESCTPKVDIHDTYYQVNITIPAYFSDRDPANDVKAAQQHQAATQRDAMFGSMCPTGNARNSCDRSASLETTYSPEHTLCLTHKWLHVCLNELSQTLVGNFPYYQCNTMQPSGRSSRRSSTFEMSVNSLSGINNGAMYSYPSGSNTFIPSPMSMRSQSSYCTPGVSIPRSGVQSMNSSLSYDALGDQVRSPHTVRRARAKFDMSTVGVSVIFDQPRLSSYDAMIRTRASSTNSNSASRMSVPGSQDQSLAYFTVEILVEVKTFHPATGVSFAAYSPTVQEIADRAMASTLHPRLMQNAAGISVNKIDFSSGTICAVDVVKALPAAVEASVYGLSPCELSPPTPAPRFFESQDQEAHVEIVRRQIPAEDQDECTRRVEEALNCDESASTTDNQSNEETSRIETPIQAEPIHVVMHPKESSFGTDEQTMSCYGGTPEIASMSETNYMRMNSEMLPRAETTTTQTPSMSRKMSSGDNSTADKSEADHDTLERENAQEDSAKDEAEEEAPNCEEVILSVVDVVQQCAPISTELKGIDALAERLRSETAATEEQVSRLVSLHQAPATKTSENGGRRKRKGKGKSSIVQDGDDSGNNNNEDLDSTWAAPLLLSMQEVSETQFGAWAKSNNSARENMTGVLQELVPLRRTIVELHRYICQHATVVKTREENSTNDKDASCCAADSSTSSSTLATDAGGCGLYLKESLPAMLGKAEELMERNEPSSFSSQWSSFVPIWEYKLPTKQLHGERALLGFELCSAEELEGMIDGTLSRLRDLRTRVEDAFTAQQSWKQFWLHAAPEFIASRQAELREERAERDFISAESLASYAAVQETLAAKKKQQQEEEEQEQQLEQENTPEPREAAAAHDRENVIESSENTTTCANTQSNNLVAVETMPNGKSLSAVSAEDIEEEVGVEDDENENDNDANDDDDDDEVEAAPTSTSEDVGKNAAHHVDSSPSKPSLPSTSTTTTKRKSCEKQSLKRGKLRVAGGKTEKNPTHHNEKTHDSTQASAVHANGKKSGAIVASPSSTVASSIAANSHAHNSHGKPAKKVQIEDEITKTQNFRIKVISAFVFFLFLSAVALVPMLV